MKKNQSREFGAFTPRIILAFILCSIGASLAIAAVLTELVPGTAVLLNQSGNGGNSTSTSSSTNIFSPAAFVDYKRFGGEPTVVVDRYPFAPGQFGCPGAPNTTPCPPRDFAYASAPQGFVEPRYSTFYKSTDLGQTFRVPFRTPFTARAVGAGQGGGDSHLVVGSLTHKIYFVDLAADHITMNVSSDLGENWMSDDISGTAVDLVDDRQWVEADETAPLPAGNTGNVYISAINIGNPALPTLALLRSTQGAAPGSFNIGSTCTTATFGVGANPTDPAANDGVSSPCPDPSDPYLWVAGPVVADKTLRNSNATHPVYVPFVRRLSQGGLGLDCPCAWQLYIAKSVDGATSWTRIKIADLPNTVNPGNIFVQMAIDRAGNLYYNWSQAQNVTADGEGEQDIYYTFSTNGGMNWVPPINLTGENNDSAVFSWMVAGDAGQVDLVYYKSNSGANSNVNVGQVWNVYFAQSQNALNTGANFKSVQVSTEPNHIGDISTGGLTGSSNRNLLDFITVDVDHLGAAHVVYSDDHQARTDTRDKLTRQIAGNSIFKNQNITLQSSWPIRDHAVSDAAGDTFDGSGIAKSPCAGMDLLGMSSSRSGDLLTVTLTLDSAPSAMKAIACGTSASGVTGGIWGAEFWAAASGTDGGTEGGNTFYVAYRDAPPAPAAVEAGHMDDVNLTVTSTEFDKTDSGTPATPGGTCFSSTPPSPCTLIISVRLSDLGISSGNGLYGLTGLSAYFFGTATKPPLLRVEGGNSELADATAPIHYLGSGTP
jgi:hypothetical protein